MRRSFLILLSLFISLLGFDLQAQPLNKATYETMIKTAEDCLENGDHYRALEWYEKAYDERNDRSLTVVIANLHYQLRDYTKAERWYSRLFRRDKENKFGEYRFVYGRALKMNGVYDEAIQEFQTFISETKNDSLKTLAQVELTGAEMAMEMRGGAKGVLVENAGKLINSKTSEYAPVLAPDGKTLYFSSFDTDEIIEVDEKNTDFHVKLYQATKNEDGWDKPTKVSNKINREGFHVPNASFSTDGSVMYFTRSALEGNILNESKIFFSKKDGSSWTGPNEVEGVNGDWIAKNPVPGELLGREVLFFVSNVEGGEGGYDIYYATKKDDGVYGDPINLGPTVNSIGDDETPFYRDGTLYFSSTGHPGYGGYDIFYTTWDGSKWSEPANMGKGFNTSLDDTYFMMDEEGYNGFLTSNREGTRSVHSKTCCDDIWSFNIPKLFAELVVGVFDKKKKPIKGSTVQLVVTKREGPTESRKNDKGNRFDFPLNLELPYKIVVSAEGYFPDSTTFNTLGLKESQTFEKFFYLKAKPVPPPEPEYDTITIQEAIVLENILYDFDDDRIKEEAESDLQVVLELMNEYPNLVIELGSHTDIRGNDQYNESLSQRRAESARRWLVRNGVQRERIQAQGYGESAPQKVSPKVSAEHDFLEEGTVLTEDFINTLEEEEQQEIAHGINRRTEFKIVEGPTTITIKRTKLKKKPPKVIERKSTRTRSRRRSNRNSYISIDTAKISKLSSLYGRSSLKGVPLMVFDERVIDFGSVKKGEKRYHTYKFINQGDTDLVISIVSACDCTIADYSTSPVKPGESAEIDVTFDSSEKDERETIDIDIILENEEPDSGNPIIERIQYKFDIKQ